MSDNAKKALLIVVTVVALVVAGLGASKMFSGDKMQVDRTVTMPPGHKSEKELALEAQKQAGTPAGNEERDLGGGIAAGGGGKANDR